MKKSLFTAFAILALTLVSCNSGNNNPETPDPERKHIDAGVSEFSWHSDASQNGTNSFHLTLIEDLVDRNGYSVHVEFNAATTDPTGEYVIGNGAAGTMLKGSYNDETLYGTYIVILDGGSYTETPEILDGSDCKLSIERMGENFVITFVNDKYEFKASCEARVTNEAFPSEPMEATNFAAKFGMGRALYYGDFYGHGVSDEYLIDFEGDNYASIDLYAPLNSPDNAIPDGTYTISPTGAPGTITPGSYERGYFDPSFIYIAIGGQTISTVWYMYSGSLTFENVDGVYHVTGSVISACGSQITIDYSGPIDVESYL